MEGRGVHQRHRTGTTEASRLYSRDARSHRRLLSATAAQTTRCTYPGRAGGDLPRARYGRIPSCNRSSVGSACLHCLPGGEPQRRSQKITGYEGGREGVGESPASEKVPACDERTSAGYGRKEATGGLVPTADLRLAQKRVS